MENQGESSGEPGGASASSSALARPSAIDVVTAEDLLGFPALHGTYPAKIDTNGRVVLPSALKGPFSGDVVLGARRSRFLYIQTTRVFDLSVEKMIAKTPDKMVSPETKNRFYKATQRVSVDKQSRFVIPESFRERVGLKERIYLCGSRSSVEIWSAEEFERSEAPDLEDIQLLMDGFEGL